MNFFHIFWAFVFYLSLKAHYWWFGYEAFAKVTSIAGQIATAIKCHYVQYQICISVWGKLDCYCLLRNGEIRTNPKIGYVACHSASYVLGCYDCFHTNLLDYERFLKHHDYALFFLNIAFCSIIFYIIIDDENLLPPVFSNNTDKPKRYFKPKAAFPIYRKNSMEFLSIN